MRVTIRIRSADVTTQHDDVIKWKHFPRNWILAWGIHREFAAQRPMMRSCDDFFVLCLNQKLSKQWRRRWGFIWLISPFSLGLLWSTRTWDFSGFSQLIMKIKAHTAHLLYTWTHYFTYHSDLHSLHSPRCSENHHPHVQSSYHTYVSFLLHLNPPRTHICISGLDDFW